MSPVVKDSYSKDRLADYVDVKERIRLFYERFPDGRLVTSKVEFITEPDGIPRVRVEALAYRTADDPLPGPGNSWMILPGATSFTRGSELENVETSAWGRAIGSLGIGIEKSVASQDEVDAKAGEAERPEPTSGGEGWRIVNGIASAGKQSPTDLQYRTEIIPGPVLGFVLVEPRPAGDPRKPTGLQVVAVGDLATELWDAIGHDGALLQNVEVTVEGAMDRIAWRKDNKQMPPYRRLTLARIIGPGFDLPAEPTPEAESVPLFSESEQKALDEALAK